MELSAFASRAIKEVVGDFHAVCRKSPSGLDHVE
jgi:hypothetical protein